jgi:hypothetical protein
MRRPFDQLSNRLLDNWLVTNIATPEATAIELVAYAEHCGYLSSVAAPVAKLAELAAQVSGPLFQNGRGWPPLAVRWSRG